MKRACNLPVKSMAKVLGNRFLCDTAVEHRDHHIKPSHFTRTAEPAKSHYLVIISSPQ